MAPRSSLFSLALVAGLFAGQAHGASPNTDLYGDPLPEGAVLRLGTVRLKSSASQMLFTPDGRTLITCESRRIIKRWNAEDGKLQQVFTAPGPFCMPEALSSDGLRYMGGDGEGGLGIWDVSSGQRVSQMTGLLCPVAALSPDGAAVAAVDGEQHVHFMDARTGKERLAPQGQYLAWGASFSPDGARLAVTTKDALAVLETATGRELWRTDERPARFVWSPDGGVIAVHTLSPKDEKAPGVIRFLNTADGKPAGRDALAAPKDLVALLYSPDGAAMAFRTRKEIVVWDLQAGKERRKLPLAPAGYWGREPFAFAPDGKTLTALVGSTLHRWDLSTGKDLYPDVSGCGCGGEAGAIAWSSDGRRIAMMSQGFDPRPRIWDAATGELLRTLPAPVDEQWWGCWLMFSPDGKRLFRGATFDDMRCWDVETGKAVWSRNPLDPDKKDSQQSPARLHLTADGSHLITIRLLQNGCPCPGEVTVWDAGTGERVNTSAVPDACVSDVFSPDGRWRVTQCGEVYDVQTGSLHNTLEARYPIGYLGNDSGAFSPDGALFAAPMHEMAVKGQAVQAVCRGIQVWETATGKRLIAIPETEFGRLAFSPDGRTIAVVGDEGLRVWDVVAGEEVYRQPVGGRLTGPWPPVAFSPDGRRLVAGCTDTTAVVWDLSAAAHHDAIEPAWTAADRDGLWDDLAADDPPKAYAAILRLAARPDDAAALLRDRLPPATGVPQDQVKRLLAALDDDDFDAREAAAHRLAEFGEHAEPALREALAAGALTAEQRSRVGKLLTLLPAVPPTETLRDLRAMRALAWSGTPDAKALLEKLADGAADAPLTREARAALARWAGRK